MPEGNVGKYPEETKTEEVEGIIKIIALLDTASNLIYSEKQQNNADTETVSRK